MVTTRGHPSSEEFEQLGEKGKTTKQQEGPIAKKPKTVPLQEADKELEEGLEQQFGKEEQLAGEASEVEQEAGKRAAGMEEEGEEEAGGRGGGRGRGGGAKGGKKGQTAEEEEEEAEEAEEEEEMKPGKAKAKAKAKAPAKGKAAKGAAAGGGKKSALGLQIGEPAPDFALKDEEGHTVALKDFKGNHVAVYFFNKAGSPVVTRGGAAFAKVFPEFNKLGIPLLFIGPDSVQSNKKFKESAGLPFPLLSDAKKEVARKFHNLRGRNVARTTVMIDPEGKVCKVWADIPENQVESNPVEALQWTQQTLQQEA